MMIYVLTASHVLLFVIIGLRVISRKLNPGASLAWLFLLGGFPIGGAVLYLLLGERTLGRVRRRRLRDLRAPLMRWVEGLNQASRVDPQAMPENLRQLAQLAGSTSQMPLLHCGPTALLEGAPAIMGAILADIKQARESCDMAFYIWSEGGLADEVAEALIAAAGRGVRCRVLLDGLGSGAFLKSAWVGRLRAAGVKVATALAVGLTRALFVRVDLRLHRKIVVIDSRIGYTGSMNLVDPRFFKQNSGVGEWIDAMLRFSGPPVAALNVIFQASWAIETGEMPQSGSAAVHESGDLAQTPACLIVPSGPDLASDDIRRVIIEAIHMARRELVITTPYFVPDEPIMMALTSAALRGVDVALIVPERVDSVLVRYASQSFFENLLLAGVKVLRYRQGLLHTKSLTVDARFSLFGTVNLDIRSLRLNFEVAALLLNEKATADIRALQAHYEGDCDALDIKVWQNRSTLQKIIENLARLASPLL